MDSPARLLLALISVALIIQGHCKKTVTGIYGGTIVVPCNEGAAAPEDLIFIKWKYEKSDGIPGDLLIKQAHRTEATVQATDGYASRVSMASNASLLISGGQLEDQRIFTCMVVSGTNLLEYPVNVLIYKKPSPPQIKDRAKELENGKLTTVGTCVAEDANPAANVSWFKNAQLLVADGTTVLISPSVKVDPATGLSTSTASLQYTATKADMGAKFTCVSRHQLGHHQESAPETFVIHYPTETLNLHVQAKGPVKEGDNVTLRCLADGNPPPRGYNFYFKGQKMTVTEADTFTLAGVTRHSAGEYKCSLVDDDKMEASENLFVSYLDLSLSPSGKVLKMVGDVLEVKMEQNTSGDAKVTWTKDNNRLAKQPTFGRLTYADAGLYVCEVSVAGIKHSQSFHLAVEGTPVIKRLTKQRSDDGKHKVLTCEAEGAPQPHVLWSVNGTQEESNYVNGKVTHKITVVPRANLTVTCVVSNKLGEDFKTINVSSLFKDEPQDRAPLSGNQDSALLIVGIVVGLLIAAAIVGLAYWIYMKKSRQGSWKTGEKETGTSEESKKLEENNHKADV